MFYYRQIAERNCLYVFSLYSQSPLGCCGGAQIFLSKFFFFFFLLRLLIIKFAWKLWWPWLVIEKQSRGGDSYSLIPGEHTEFKLPVCLRELLLWIQYKQKCKEDSLWVIALHLPAQRFFYSTNPVLSVQHYISLRQTTLSCKISKIN